MKMHTKSKQWCRL